MKKKNKKQFSISTKIAFSFTIITILVAMVFYFLLPTLLNYPPTTINTQFDKEVSKLEYIYQYLIAISGIIMLFIKLNIQRFAHVKAQGSTQNGRDSEGRRLGAKLADGQTAKAGSIIYRQRGTKIYPGKNVGMGKDHTLYALIDGTVKYERLGRDKKKVSVYEK